MATQCVCLSLKNMRKQKTTFEQLLLKYPNRMRLLLGIAYCDVYLGNKKQALDRLKKIKLGSDVAYYLSNDEIYDFEVFKCLLCFRWIRTILRGMWKSWRGLWFEWGPYYFGLWTTNQHDLFHREVDKQRTELLECIEDVKAVEDFDSEEEKQSYIQSWEDDLEALSTVVHKIKHETTSL